MADIKITALVEDTAPTLDDLILVVNDPGVSPATRKATIQNLWEPLEPLAWNSAPYIDIRYFMDGVAGRPTYATWYANQGTTDVTTVIQAAIDSISSTGGTVLIPTGSFKITAPIIPKSGVDIIGMSQYGTKILPNGNFAAIDIAEDANKALFTISNFTIDFGSTSSNPAAIGIKISSSASFYCWDFLIEKLYIKYAYNAIYDASLAFNYKIQEVHAYSTGGVAFYIHAYGAGAKTLVSLIHCYAQTCAKGFDISGVQTLKMNECTVDTCDDNPMVFTTCNGELSVCHIESNIVSAGAGLPYLISISAGNLVLNGCWFSGNTINVSAANQRTLINASSGAIVTLIGCKDNGTTLAGAGGQYVFTLMADALSRIISQNSQWTPMTAGGGNYLYCNNYINANVETWNNVQATLTVDSATPTVMFSQFFKTANTNPTTISSFTDGWSGQRIIILIQDANTTIDFTGTNLKGNIGVDWSPANGDYMDCIFDGTNWYCAVHDLTP